MKKLMILVFMLSVAFAQAQETTPTYEVEGDMVKATYYFENGAIHKQGYFKDKKLTGKWTQYNKKGDIIAVGHYKKGKKVGTWFQWTKDALRQINYENSTVASVNIWKENTKVASNK